MTYHIYQLLDADYNAIELATLPIDWEQRLVTHPHDYRHVHHTSFTKPYEYDESMLMDYGIIVDYDKDILVTYENPKTDIIKYLKHFEVLEILAQTNHNYRRFKRHGHRPTSHHTYPAFRDTSAPIKADLRAKIINNEYAKEYRQLKIDTGRFTDEWDDSYVKGHDPHARKRTNSSGWKHHKYRHQWEHNLH